MYNSNTTFFASTNSGEGFINKFPEIFSKTDRLYIIKGGPGTGKSSLMKYIAAEAQSNGYSVESFCCASDPSSLDGIIINELKLGMTDGTAPHTMDPVYPGTHGDIINLGNFWDSDLLKSHNDDIINLISKKSRLYDVLYRYLNSALVLQRLNRQVIASAVDIDKMRKSIRRILKNHRIESGSNTLRLTEGITMNGFVKLTPYDNIAEKVYTVSDKYGISGIYFDILKSELSDKEIIASYDALDPGEINMIYIPSCKILFCKYDTEVCKKINTERFFKRNELLITSKDLNGNRSQINKLVECGIKVFKNIKDIHFSLEEIYVKAMDFNAKEEFQHKLANKIFS